MLYYVQAIFANFVQKGLWLVIKIPQHSIQASETKGRQLRECAGSEINIECLTARTLIDDSDSDRMSLIYSSASISVAKSQ